MAKDYYAILGVLPTATLEEIRSAYRKRAKEYHPDRSGRDSSLFLNLREAYDVLSDPADRRSYDRTLKPVAVRRSGSSLSGPPAVEPLRDDPTAGRSGRVPPVRPIETLRPSFEWMPDALGGAFDTGFLPLPGPAGTPVIEVLLSPERAREGGAIRLLVPVERPCASCLGFGFSGLCECSRCHGTGSFLQQCPLELELPPGIPDSCEVIVPMGSLGLSGRRLLLIFKIAGAESEGT